MAIPPRRIEDLDRKPLWWEYRVVGRHGARGAGQSVAERSLVRGTKCMALDKRSNMVKMAVLPFDGGRPVIKSRAMWDQGWEGTVSG